MSPSQISTTWYLRSIFKGKPRAQHSGEWTECKSNQELYLNSESTGQSMCIWKWYFLFLREYTNKCRPWFWWDLGAQHSHVMPNNQPVDRKVHGSFLLSETFSPKRQGRWFIHAWKCGGCMLTCWKVWFDLIQGSLLSLCGNITEFGAEALCIRETQAKGNKQ